LLRADGTGGSTLQNSAIGCDDSGNLTGVGTVNSIKAYRAVLTQTGTAAPVATVGENTLGQTATWSRTAGGLYTLTAGGVVFTANKTQVFIGPYNDIGGGGSGPDALPIFIARRGSTTTIVVSTSFSDPAGPTLTGTDEMLNETAITLLVYP
jgi:hypothetical protein